MSRLKIKSIHFKEAIRLINLLDYPRNSLELKSSEYNGFVYLEVVHNQHVHIRFKELLEQNYIEVEIIEDKL